jgi:hypothetical protein
VGDRASLDRKVGTFLFSRLAGIRTLNLWIMGQVFYYCATDLQVRPIFTLSGIVLSDVLGVSKLSVSVLSDVVLSVIVLSDIVLSVVVLNYQYCI